MLPLAPFVPTRVGCRDSANSSPCPTVQEASAGVNAGASGAGDFLEDQLHRVRMEVPLLSPAIAAVPSINGTGTGIPFWLWMCYLIPPLWGDSDGRTGVLKQLPMLWML